MEHTMFDEESFRDFAKRYTAAGCSQNAAGVASFFAPNGSLKINDGEPAVGLTAITDAAQSFMTAFPDLRVAMDQLLVQDPRHIPLDPDRQKHRSWRNRQLRASQRLRAVGDQRQ